MKKYFKEEQYYFSKLQDQRDEYNKRLVPGIKIKKMGGVCL